MIKSDIILLAVEFALSVGLFILAQLAVKYVSAKWRILYAVPAVFCIVMLALDGFEKCLLGVYIGAVLMLAGFFCDKANIRKITSAAAALGILVSVPLCLSTKDYRATDYTKDFEKGFRLMKEHYILAEYKGIDWDSLYDEYLPKFKQATAENDSVQNQIVWMQFCAEFGDGHVGYMSADEELFDKAQAALAGSDYGLSMMTLSDGRTAAVNVDESLSAQGIYNGTIILSWDGEKPESLANKSQLFEVYPFADKENREFYRAIFAAGVGGESVSIRYLDESGTEQTAVLPKLGAYGDRVKRTLEIVEQGLKAGHMSWTDVGEKAVCLRIKLMSFDRRSETSNDFSAMKSSIEAELAEYNEKGYEKLVIDLRDNGGGSGIMVRTLAEIFAPEGEHYYCTDGKWDEKNRCYAVDENGSFIPDKDNYYTGENQWHGKPIIILVNANSASASDHFVHVMRGFENVTVMGFTKSNGSAQGVGSVILDNGAFSFSSSLILNKDGSIFIDAGADGICGNDVDVKIPIDENAIRVLFDEGGDYVMQQALAYTK